MSHRMSIQVMDISESPTLIREVVDDAQTDIEHGKKLKRKNDEELERYWREQVESELSDVSDEPSPVPQRRVEISYVRSNKRKSSHMANKLMGSEDGRVTIISGSQSEKRSKQTQDQWAPPPHRIIPRNLFPESSSSPGSGIPSQLHVTISNIVSDIVQDVQPLLMDEEPLKDQHLELIDELVVEDTETLAISNGASSQVADTNLKGWHPPLAITRRQPDQPVQGEITQELDEENRLQIYGVYFRTLSQIGTLTTTNPLFFCYLVRGILVLKFIFMTHVIPYVPLQHFYVMLQYILDLCLGTLSIPRLHMEHTDSSFVPSQVWYTIRTSYFLDFRLSIRTWDDEMRLRRTEYIRHVEYLVDIQRLIDRLFNERLRVLHVLSQLAPSISSGDSFIDLS